MTPMIDVTFQLIAFFMFVLNFSEVDQDQRINLPLQRAGQAARRAVRRAAHDPADRQRTRCFSPATT